MLQRALLRRRKGVHRYGMVEENTVGSKELNVREERKYKAIAAQYFVHSTRSIRVHCDLRHPGAPQIFKKGGIVPAERHKVGFPRAG
jgi:hypothetical protein